jgi:hypothetical protein
MRTLEPLKRITAAALAAVALGSVTLACERREGPAEEAGEAVDDTLDEVDDAVDDAE